MISVRQPGLWQAEKAECLIWTTGGIMHEVIESAIEALGIDLPALQQAHEHSTKIRNDAHAYLTSAVPPDELPLDVLVLGSLARDEASGQSDLDYLVISHGLADDVGAARELIRHSDDLCAVFDLNPPGRTGMFGEVVAASDLVERIGLEQDTNLTHSRRILILQESSSVYRPDLHKKLTEAVLERYLLNHRDGPVPRFLLNDVVRYWRTLAVDYEAKRWQSQGQPWGLRYLKLILSRKLVYAGTLVSLLGPTEPTVGNLYDQFALPPLARLAQLAEHLRSDSQGLEALRRTLLISDNFQVALADEEFRKAIKDAESPDDDSIPEFQQTREMARELQEHLETLFYKTEVLGPASNHYLGF